MHCGPKGRNAIPGVHWGDAKRSTLDQKGVILDQNLGCGCQNLRIDLKLKFRKQ